jgi:hypothetical protein
MRKRSLCGPLSQGPWRFLWQSLFRQMSEIERRES